MATVTDPKAIAHIRRKTILYALRLEILGMTRSGPPISNVIKNEFGLTGNKKELYEKFEALIEEMRPPYPNEPI